MIQRANAVKLNPPNEPPGERQTIKIDWPQPPRKPMQPAYPRCFICGEEFECSHREIGLRKFYSEQA